MVASLRAAARACERHLRRSRVRVTRERLRWTIRVRATVIAVFLVVAVAGWLRGVLPSLAPALVAAGGGALMNVAAARRIARWEGIPGMLAWTGAGDALLITYVVARTGGTASPFLSLYVLQVLTTALVVDVALGACMGAISVLLLGVASFACRPLAPDVPLVGASEPLVRLASFGVTLLFLVFVGGVLTRRLTESERELAGTHRRLARSLRRLTATHASLQEAYRRLALAEAGLVESDRMKTLQLLVAGLAHELGNPLAVLAGTIEPLAESVRAYERALAAYVPYAASSGPLAVRRDVIASCGAGGETTAAPCALADTAGAGRGGDAPSSSASLRDAAAAWTDADAALAAAAEARRETPLLLANCAEATARAGALLAQLREFGRGGKGTVRRPAALAPGLVATLALLRYRLRPGITVHEDYADVPDVVCVPAEMNQVVINLLMNALDALAANGNLWLALASDGDEVRIVVRDDGAGIPDDVLPRVFEPFVTTKEAGRGTGLGLAISRAIVARHGGRIDLVSVRGRGTTVTVRLPAVPSRPGA